jgi:phosphoglycolate phosphatase
MKNQFDLIIFDWDGTLIDSIDWIAKCLQKAGDVCQYGIPDDQAAKDVIGLSIKKAMQVLFPDQDDASIERLIACYSEEYFSKTISQADLFPGVYDMLGQLRDYGFQLAVATGKTRVGLDEALDNTQTRHLFEVTRCADETASKPDPKMLHEIIAHVGVDKSRTLMIGDSIHDLAMAQNAQIASIGVSCGAHAEVFLQQYSPLYCLQQPTQLLDIISNG